MFNVNFLNNYYAKSCHELPELFNQKKKKDVIEFFQGEYVFSGRHWYTGEYWRVPLPESIRYNERLKVAHLKREKLPIPAEFQQQDQRELFFLIQ